MSKKVYLYKRFERFWHWSQTLLIFSLIFTGFEIHGVTAIMGYEEAVIWHNNAAWAFMILIVFAIFWHLTTDEWKNYVPTIQNFKAQAEYYLTGIFQKCSPSYKEKDIKQIEPLTTTYLFWIKNIADPLNGFNRFIIHVLSLPRKRYRI